MSRSSATASRVTATPTTTYPFSYTTYSTSLSSSSFTKPTVFPSMFPFGAGESCSANSVATPVAAPSGSQAACAISNAREVNDHAFWDLYACCNGGALSALGSPQPCTAQCVAGNGQTWQQLGECLSKRVEVVVCKPAANEIGSNGTTSSVGPSSTASGTRAPSASGSGSASASASRSASASVSASRSAAQPSASTGAASTVGAAQVKGVKAAVGMFVMLAAGSVAGMLL